jgi:hypothetical protein
VSFRVQRVIAERCLPSVDVEVGSDIEKVKEISMD